MIDDGLQDYYDPSFRDVLEAHLSWLRAHRTTYTLAVTSFNLLVYNRNLSGFLIENKIPMKLHWLTMRMSGLYAPTDFTEGVEALLVPNTDTVERLRQAWKTVPVIVQ